MAHNWSPGVDVVGPGQRELVDIQQHDVTPRVSDEWLPELLEQLLPYATEAVRSYAVHLY